MFCKIQVHDLFGSSFLKIATQGARVSRGIRVVLKDSIRFTKKLCARKKSSDLKLPSFRPVVFINMNTYMLKKGRTFESYNCFG